MGVKINNWNVTCSRVKIWWTNDSGATNVGARRGSRGIGVNSPPTSLSDTPPSSGTYLYTITNSGSNGSSQAQVSLTYGSGCATVSSSAFIQTRKGTFEVLVPRAAVINDYTHNQVKAVSVSLIQSISGQLEAIARVSPPSGEEGGDYLVGFESEPTADWRGPVKLMADNGPINAVTGSSSLIQSSYDGLDKFELLVPRAASEGAVIDHYVHEKGTILEGAWTHVETLKLPEAGPQSPVKAVSVSLVQSVSGALEAIARVSPAGEGTDYLVGYEFSPLTTDWQGPVKLVADDGPIDAVTGTPAFIQSNYDTPDKFELLVPRKDTSGAAVLDHYIHEKGTILEGPWRHAHTLKLPQDDPQSQAKAVWLIQSASKKLEAIARVSPSSGGTDYLVGYEFDLTSGWQGPVKLVADDGPILAGDTLGEQTSSPIG